MSKTTNASDTPTPESDEIIEMLRDNPKCPKARRAMRELERQRNEARAERDGLRRALEASERLRTNRYMPWANAGGPDQCSHKIAAGIPCRYCDEATLEALRDAKEGR